MNPETEKLWKKALGDMQTLLNPMTYRTWILKITAENLTEDSIDLVLISDYAKKQTNRFASLIADALERVSGKKLAINFVVREDIGTPTEKPDKPLGPLFIDNETQRENGKGTKVDVSIIRRSGLTPKFTFENYLVGPHNQLAYAIAIAVANKVSTDYNPFFLYSGVGLGKTHLLQAIGNKILLDNPKTNLLYTTGEAFTNELIESIQSGKGKGKYTANEFRKKFRSADVLLIDDVQFIIGRETTQEEFFHTFNTLYMEGKQLVFTSDRPPKDFTTLEKRITSRFSSGIIADIQQPDMDMRVAILRHKRDSSSAVMANEVIDFIAQAIHSNVRELEGAYLQVVAKALAIKTAPTIEIAQEVLGTNTHAMNKHVGINQILKAVCKYYAVKAEDVKGKRRTKEMVLPRQVAMYLIYDITKTPLMSIGDFLGGRDHTTIMHGVEKIKHELKETERIRQEVAAVRQLL
ncbi:chromosomal replication initiator protein DnaA [Patescibacteria group bacterium]|nr:chromosomal replication initiator protein DnaA [Patescibacteria group bacterium]